MDVAQVLEDDHDANDVVEIVDQELEILEGLLKPAKLFDTGVVATLNYEDDSFRFSLYIYLITFCTPPTEYAIS